MLALADRVGGQPYRLVGGDATRVRVYLPDRMPFSSGLQAATDIPNASAIGSSSRSMSRLSRLYGTWSAANCDQPRHSARVLARDTTWARAFADTDVQHFPGARGVIEGPHGLLEGEARSQMCTQ